MSQENQPKAAEDENENQSENESESGQIRPDPMFKEYTAEQARKVGLEFRNVELPQLSLNDLVLAVPDKLDLSDTMFDFFGKVNIVEFKSENDPLTFSKLSYNQARAWLMVAKGEVDKLEDLMSVFICAKYPQSVTEVLQQKSQDYRAEHEWLLRCQLGGIEIAIVVCRLLPIERKYYWWLMFAPTGSKKWQSFVTMLLEEGDLEMLRIVARIRPVEVGAMTTQANRRPKKSAAEEEAFAKMMAEMYHELIIATENNPVERAKVVQMGVGTLTPEEVAATLSPEQLAALSPEQRLAGLEPEQRLAGLSAVERQKLLELLSQPTNPGGEEKA